MLRFNRIVVEDLNSIFSQDQIKELMTVAARKRQYFVNAYKFNTNKTSKDYTIGKIVLETVYRKSEFMKYNDYEKAFLVANMIFPNNKKFIEALYHNNIDASVIKLYLDCVKWLKGHSEDTMNPNYPKILKFVEHYRIIMSKIFTIQMGGTDPEVIINKLNQIVSLEPELLDSYGCRGDQRSKKIH